MKKVLKIIAGGVIIIVLALVIALFVKKEYAVERSLSISRSRQDVFEYVKYLKNQDQFSVWARIDPGMKKEYRGTDGTVGFVSAWDSDNKHAGKGEQEIVKITDGEKIDYVIRFFEPMESTDNAFFSFNPVNDSTTNVKWGFYGSMKYPMNLMMLFMNMDAMLGKDLEGGLNNLKEKLESEAGKFRSISTIAPKPAELRVEKRLSLNFTERCWRRIRKYCLRLQF